MNIALVTISLLLVFWGFSPKNHVVIKNQHKAVEIINDYRKKNGLKPLEQTEKLNNVSFCRAKYLYDNNLFVHDGFQKCFSKNKVYGFFGENLARNWKSYDDMVVAWMNSPTHRDNVLGNYNYIGFYDHNGYSVASFAFSK